MQITLERRGGFTGISHIIKVDTATLPPEQAAQVRHLVETANFFRLPPAASMPAQPDRFEYEVTVQEGAQTHTVTFGEVTAPASLQPLVSWLINMA